VLDALHRQRIEHPAPRVIGAGDPWRYRLRGEFHVIAGSDGHAPALGFNRARSWRPIAVDDCLIHHPRITTALPALRTLIASSGKPDLGTLHLTAGEDGQELLVRPKPSRGLAPGALDAGLDLPDGGRVSTTSTTLRWRGLTFRVTADAFIQVNWAQMDVLYQCAVDALGGHAGLGTLIFALLAIGLQNLILAQPQPAIVEDDAARLGAPRVGARQVEQLTHTRISRVTSPRPDSCRCPRLARHPPG